MIRTSEVMALVRQRYLAARDAGTESNIVSRQIEILAQVLVEQVNAEIAKLRKP